METQPSGSYMDCSQGATRAVGQPAWLPASVWGSARLTWQQDESLLASLTEKKPRTSGLRRDISSMSLSASSTSENNGYGWGV